MAVFQIARFGSNPKFRIRFKSMNSMFVGIVIGAIVLVLADIIYKEYFT